MDRVDAATKLQRIILSWDYWELVRKSEAGGGPFDSIRQVPLTFTDIQDYKSVFEPLLLEECCAQVLRGVEEGEVLSPHPCVASKFEMKEDFMYVRLVLQPGEQDHYVDNDLVLLCKDNPMEADDQGQSPTDVSGMHALGVCEGREGQQSVRIKFMLTDESQANNPPGLARTRGMRTGLEVQGSCWWLLKLSNMSTIGREWVALQNAHMCPFMDILLSAKPRIADKARHMDIPPGMSETMESQCNGSQMEALRAGLDGSPLVLIQGPPGTGKTRTILNLLSVIMHAASKNALELLKGSGSAKGQVDGSQVLEAAARNTMWLTQSPWVVGLVNPRDDIMPYDPLPPHIHSNNCWGLTLTSQPLRLGKGAGPKAHVLVCAPSNSALDEIVLRIMKSGLMDEHGNMYSPSVVRIGVNVHHSVKAVSLDVIVDARLGGDGDGSSKGTGALSSRMERDRMRIAILDEASVVCSTLSFAGSSIFSRLTRKFDVVVVDEAAQAVEPSTIVPLIMQGCKQVYLVGDPVQLPATVISTRALERGYDVSLFKRLQCAGYPVKMLNTQYRMNPAISAFPSRQFYSGSLLDGETVVAETTKPWHDHKCFGPLAFFDVTGKESIPPNGASIQNMSEANMVLCIFRELVHRFPTLRQTASVAVISPYKAQVKLIRESFKSALGEEAAQLIDVNTIDGFQGREKDICIFSCVRSLRQRGQRASIGFVADERRINVGLTRARCSLMIVGNARALQANEHWASLISDCMTRGCLFRPQAPFNEWMTEVAAGKVEAVVPTEEELAALGKARDVLVAAKESVAGDVSAQLAEALHEDDLHAEDEGLVKSVQAALEQQEEQHRKEHEQQTGGKLFPDLGDQDIHQPLSIPDQPDTAAAAVRSAGAGEGAPTGKTPGAGGDAGAGADAQDQGDDAVVEEGAGRGRGRGRGRGAARGASAAGKRKGKAGEGDEGAGEAAAEEPAAKAPAKRGRKK